MSDRENDYLYHYTTAEGLIGIVKTRKIWATNILYLNDVKEFRHGVELSGEYVKQLLEKATDPGERTYLEKLAASVEELKTTGEAPGYVCSFSKWRDDLSQWRAYCPGGGFAIGFPKGLLGVLALEGRYVFEKCSYDLERQRRTVSAFIDLGVGADRDLATWPTKCQWAIMRLATASATLKDPAFSSEEEWRMARYPGPESEKQGVDFRARNGVPVPYMVCDLEFTEGAITREMWKAVRVTVGPSPSPEASRASVEKLLRLSSPAESPGEVTLTAVPYKFW